MNLVFKWIPSPVGPLKLVGHDAGLAAILWENDDPRRVRLSPLAEVPDHGLLVAAEQELSEYFRGERRAFDRPLALAGTPLQIRVWQALLTIPYGETEATAPSRARSASPRPCAPSALRTAETRSRSWCHAIAWSAHRAP
jgi:methylated-DNA-[protein]-cysteine S-methyltransferase